MSLDPADWQSFRREAHRVLDDMLDHVETLRAAPLWRDPNESPARLDTRLPLAGQDFAKVYATFRTDILPFDSGNTHPGFMGWVQGAGTPAGMMAELMAATMNLNCGGRHHIGPIVEQQIGDWMRELFGFPDMANGLFLTGASQANFIAVLVARTRALGTPVRQHGLARASAQLVAYASKEAHGCIPRAMEMAGLGTDQLRLIDVDADHRIDLAALERAIAADRKAGLTPFLLIGSAGTVNVGSIDDLDALADLAAREAISFHIDGALGALCVASKRLAPLFRGLSRCDSLAFDFHKWGHVPYDAGYLLVRDGEMQRATFASNAAYLTRSAEGLAAGDWWACDYGPDLSRGFRALKAWFTLKTYGMDGIAAQIEANCALAARLAERVDSAPELERLAPVALNIVNLRYRPSALATNVDALNRAIVENLHREGLVAPSITILNGQIAIRAAILNHRTEATDIDCLIDSVLRLGRALASHHASDT
jgi:aromatic-L-amino-acid decarboxylase